MRKSILHAVWMFCLTFTAFAQSGLVYETRTVKSDILKMERKYAIYLPPGYAESDQSYPVLYLLHGAGDDHTGWVQFGQVQHIADQAVAEGKAARMILQKRCAEQGTEKDKSEKGTVYSFTLSLFPTRSPIGQALCMLPCRRSQ